MQNHVTKQSIIQKIKQKKKLNSQSHYTYQIDFVCLQKIRNRFCMFTERQTFVKVFAIQKYK